MASEQSNYPVNGNYGSHGGQYVSGNDPQLSSHPQANAATASGPAPGAFGSQNANLPQSANNTVTGSNKHAEIPKDEVGWYFVEQYYTNLSRSPDKLHLFFTKKSQFVWGVEDEKVAVSVGRTAIAEKIKELEFQDCKVRVLNVDSQSSFQNIVIQVIGEMSNKSAPHRKFVQTFVLAEQPNGYFVLNDIFRYLNDDDEEEDGQSGVGELQSAPLAHGLDDGLEKTEVDEPKDLIGSGDTAQQEHDAELVDKRLEQKSSDRDIEAEPHGEVNPSATLTNGTNGHANASDHGPNPEEAEAALAQEELSTDIPITPEPTRAASPIPIKTAPIPPTPASPPKPVAPKTWANLVASSSSASVAPPSSSTPSAAQPQQKAISQQPDSENNTSPSQPRGNGQATQNTGSGTGWQTAGNDSSKRQTRPQSNSGINEKEHVLAYVKNVTEKVPAEALKAALSKFGELAYFDISRAKNCAFVEFATATGYNGAVAANPHQIAGEAIYVEERRPRSGAYGGSGYNQNRGGLNGRGRGGLDGRPGGQGRGGFQKDGGRGGYIPGRGRGGNLTPRGRGVSQTN